MLLSHTMSRIDKISVAITREQHAKIKAAVDRGDYASTSEVIRTALREWELKEEMRRLEGERIARLWDEGIASGPAVEGPPVLERLRAKYEALEKAKNGKKRSRKVA
jgi:antitoxin ParD1/3/4